MTVPDSIRAPGFEAREEAASSCPSLRRMAPRGAIGVVAGLLAWLPVAAQAAGDPVVGRKKALQCQTCHGLDGIAKIPEAANLAGQTDIYLVSALHDYKSGARKNDMMSTIAPMLSDADMDDLAAYYSGIEITVKVPGH